MNGDGRAASVGVDTDVVDAVPFDVNDAEVVLRVRLALDIARGLRHLHSLPMDGGGTAAQRAAQQAQDRQQRQQQAAATPAQRAAPPFRDTALPSRPQGLLHLDLHPGNVVIDSWKFPKYQHPKATRPQQTLFRAKVCEVV